MTPIVTIAPLVILWVKWIPLALLICAWLVAFFPVLSNTVLGLTSTDKNLVDLFRLYGATRWQAFRYLRLPSALPRILEAGYTLQIPRMFAALFLISAAGVLIFALLTGLSRLLLRRWHESESNPAIELLRAAALVR